MTFPDVLGVYQSRIAELQASLAHGISKQAEYSWIAAGAGLLFVLLLAVAGVKRIVPIGTLAIPFSAGALALRQRERWRIQVLSRQRLLNWYEAGVGRISGTWAGNGHSGEEYSQPGHLYDRDLRVLGRGSLFELICTARTEAGRRRLAKFLTGEATLEQVRGRQETVLRLKPHTELREKIALLGKFDFEECRGNAFQEWLDRATPPLPRRVLQLSSLLAACLLGILYQALPWNPVIVPWGIAGSLGAVVAAIQCSLRFRYRRSTETMVNDSCALAGDLSILRAGLELLGHPSSADVRRLERLAAALSNSLQGPLESFSRFLLVDAHLALSMQDWKRRHGANPMEWLTEWAEFEALNCVAGYSYEHPEDATPELTGESLAFEADGLGHPLLHQSVRNDVALGERTKFYVISGSNMAGKSTLMRAIGLNAVLANAGAPVRAARARMSKFAICASMAVEDSLLEGKSKFLAEMQRIKNTIATARTGRPTLFLIDEMLSGTNSRDWRIVSEYVIRELVQRGAIGAISTHDLALTEIAEAGGLNVHMSSREEEDPLAFDFVLKPGVYQDSNALAIARMAGVEVQPV